jgi:hypothetical protein
MITYLKRRRLINLLVIAYCLLVSVGASAQNTQVAKIRKMYGEAKEVMANKQKAELPPDETVVTSNYMAAGAGPIKDETHYFYSGDFDEDLGAQYYTPYFITRKYNVGARNYYEEYLFDKGSLVFYFCKSQNDETRYYWGTNGFFHQDVKGQKMMDEVIASRIAYDLKDAFDKLMNREF